MRQLRTWKYRIYPSKKQQQKLDHYLNCCKTLWNFLLEHTKKYYLKTGKFPHKAQLCNFTKDVEVYSQVAQNVADRLNKSLKGVIVRKKLGMEVGFPRFKSIDRVKSFTYPQFGFKLEKKLELSSIGSIAIKKHRDIEGKTKTLTIKKTNSGKWFAIFTSEIEKELHKKKEVLPVGVDLGIEHFAYLSDGTILENPRHLKQAEDKLKNTQTKMSKKKKNSKNRRKARIKLALAHERLTNRRRDFLHKISRNLVEKYTLVALEDLNVTGMAKGFLAKHVLDCSWAEFSNMLHYKAEGAGSEVVLIDPAHTTQECSICGLIQKKSLTERWHSCLCGASMHRDLNAAINILIRATLGHRGCKACGEDCSSTLKEAGSPAL